MQKAQELVDVDQQATEKQAVEPQKEGEPQKETEPSEPKEVQYHENSELNEAMKNYVLYREESGHPLMKSQISATLAHVAFLDPDIHRQAEMLNQTVVNGGKSIYPIKEQNQGKAFAPQRTNYNKPSSKPNQFHNFNERDYDLDKLEKELLEKQWEPAELSGAQKEPAIDLEPQIAGTKNCIIMWRILLYSVRNRAIDINNIYDKINIQKEFFISSMKYSKKRCTLPVSGNEKSGVPYQ